MEKSTSQPIGETESRLHQQQLGTNEARTARGALRAGGWLSWDFAIR